MSTVEPGRASKVVFSLLAALLLLLVLETLSTAVLFRQGGSLFTPARAQIERSEAARDAAAHANLAPAGAESPARADPPRNARADARQADPQRDESAPEVLHPFLGFVRDPTVPGSRFPFDRLGFHASAPPAGEAPLTVGIFGGSVAVGLSRSELLAEGLGAALGREVWVRSFALGGYKQPQQLLALNYVLALDQQLDVVINLDGFNDVALAHFDFERQGLFPAYPHQWPRRVADLPDARSQRLVGEIAYLESVRSRRARWCGSAPLAWSPTCHLVWRAFEQRAGRRLASLREALSLAERPAAGRSYLALGPQVEHNRASLLEELVQLWSRSSEQMHQLCTGRGIRYYHFLQPNQYDPGSKPLSRKERRQAISDTQPWAEIVPAAYPRLSEVGQDLRRRGVAFHDMRRIFVGVEQSLYFDTCCHFNDVGLDLLAEAIVAVVLEDFERSGEAAAGDPAAGDPAAGDPAG